MNVPKVPPLGIAVFLTPHSDPGTEKGAKECPSHHAHGATHHQAHLFMVKAAWLGLSIGIHGHRNLAYDLSLSNNYSFLIIDFFTGKGIELETLTR